MAYLESQLTTTNIVSLPPEFGNPSMKSMLTSDQITLGIGSGDSNQPASVD